LGAAPIASIITSYASVPIIGTTPTPAADIEIISRRGFGNESRQRGQRHRQYQAGTTLE
jgi:hypothetical protein